LEILPFLSSLDVGRTRTALALDHRVVVDQFSVARHPLVVLDVADRFPPGEIFTVEDGYGRTPSLGHGALQFGSPYAGNRGTRSVAAFLDAREFVAGAGKVPGSGRSAGCRFGERENQVAIIDLGCDERAPGSAARLESTVQLALFFGDFHPLRERVTALWRNRQIPAARIRTFLGRGGHCQNGNEYRQNARFLHFRSF